MANTISLLNYANTFGDWVVTTNALVKENNDIAANNYHKTSGTLFLDTNTLALQSNGNAVFAQQLAVQGTGSSAYIQNNANIGGQTYLTNTSLSLVTSGPIFANGAATGLTVANNALISGQLTVTSNTNLNKSLIVANSTILNNTLNVVGVATLSNTVNISGITNVSNTVNISKDLNVTSNIVGSNNLTILASTNTNTLQVLTNTVTNTLQANTNINTATLSVTGTSFTNNLQANTGANTATLSVTGTATVNIVQANTLINTATISVTGTSFTTGLQANTNVNTAVLSVTGTSFTNNVQANTGVNTAILSVTGTSFTNNVQANTGVNTAVLSVTGTTFTNNIQANTNINTASLAASGIATVNGIQANTNVNTATLSVTGTTFANNIQANTGVSAVSLAASGTATVNAVQANTNVNTATLSVTGTTFTTGLQANTNVNTSTLSVTGTTFANNIQANTGVSTVSLAASGTTFTNGLQANTNVNTATASVTGTAFVNNLQANTGVNTAVLSVTGTTSTNNLQANTNISTASLAASGTATVNTVQANTLVNTAVLSVTGTTSTNGLQANTNVNTATLSVTGTSFTNNLQANTNISTASLAASGTATVSRVQANTNVNTAVLSVTGTTFTNALQANTGVSATSLNSSGTTFTAGLQANTNVNTATLSVTGTAFTTGLQANTNVNTATLSVTGTTFTAGLQANTSVTTPSLTINSGGKIDANNAGTSYFSNIQALGQLSVGGNFVINGTTVYNTNTFTLNAGSSSGQISYFNVNRGITGANASIRWNESIQNWDIRDINSSNYSRILTDQYLSNSTTTANSTLVASSAAVNTLQGALNTANSYLTSNVATLNSTISSTNTWLQNFANNASNINQGTLNAARLPLTSANPGTYGGIAQIPVFTVDNTGRITSITNTASSGVTGYSYNSANNTFTLSTSSGTVYNSTINQVADFTVTGNLIVNGVTTTVDTSTIQTKDSLIKLANGNAADSLDVGFYGQYNSTGTKYAGLIRKAGGNFYLLQGLTTDPTANSVTFTTSNRATLNANLTGGTVSGLSSLIAIADGGTNNNTFGNGQQVVFADSKITTRANTTTNIYGVLSSSNTISGLTYNSYGELTSYTATPIAITSSQVSGLAQSATTDTTNASNISSGTLPNARLVSVPNSALANSTISGVALGSNLYNLTGNTVGTGLSGSVVYNGSSAATFTIISNADSANGSGTLVSRDINGNFSANNITANVTGNILGNVTGDVTGNVTGNAGTVTNGVYTTGTYSNPTWITGLVWSKISTTPTTLSGYGITDATSSAMGTAAYNRANTSANSIVGTSGTVTPTNGSITLTSTNGITAVGSANTITINTAQDIRSTATPTFAGLNLSAQPLAIASGGTGQTSQSGALTALLPTGTSAGYVLTTGGPGNFYWSAVSGSGGATPGTTINSTRLSYVGDGANTKYTTPTFTTGTQLRTYINGVRQFESEYSANSANSTIIFSTAPSNADNILIEVDGYYSNPYYANNITFTVPFGGIVSSANTIQLAIQDLETRKAALISPSFTGIPLATTAATGTSNTMIATTAFVNNTANSGATFTHSITGNAGTVTNGVYTNSTYNDPTWITGIANTKINGLITSVQIAGITSSHVTAALGYTPVAPISNTQFYSVGVGTAASNTAGEIRATNNITAYYSSDRKFKENITEINNAVEIVSHIGGKLFDWTDEYINARGGEDGYFIQKSDFGVIAQDVQAVFPRAIRVKSDETLAVDYEKLCALAFAAIRELKAEIDTLKGI